MRRIVFTIACMLMTAFVLDAQESKSRYQGALETGIIANYIMFDGSTSSYPSLDFDYIAGARINKKNFWGGGIGFNHSLIGLLIPIYANYKHYYVKSENDKTYPFFNLSFGLNLGLADSLFFPGYLLNLSGGYHVELSSENSFYFSLGIESIMLELEPLIGPVLRLGFAF